jgi:hypothetical protein
VAQAAATAAVAPAIGALCLSYTGPRPVQTFRTSKSASCALGSTASSTTGSTASLTHPPWETQRVPGRACNKPEALSPTSQKSTTPGTRLVTGTTGLTPSATRRRQLL